MRSFLFFLTLIPSDPFLACMHALGAHACMRSGSDGMRSVPWLCEICLYWWIVIEAWRWYVLFGCIVMASWRWYVLFGCIVIEAWRWYVLFGCIVSRLVACETPSPQPLGGVGGRVSHTRKTNIMGQIQEKNPSPPKRNSKPSVWSSLKPSKWRDLGETHLQNLEI